MTLPGSRILRLPGLVVVVRARVERASSSFVLCMQERMQNQNRQIFVRDDLLVLQYGRQVFSLFEEIPCMRYSLNVEDTHVLLEANITVDAVR